MNQTYINFQIIIAIIEGLEFLTGRMRQLLIDLDYDGSY